MSVNQEQETQVVTKIVKPDAFLCEFDTARWAYLQSRDMEYAYRHVQKIHKKETLNPEKMLESEALLREMSRIFDEADKKISTIVNKIRSL